MEIFYLDNFIFVMGNKAEVNGSLEEEIDILTSMWIYPVIKRSSHKTDFSSLTKYQGLIKYLNNISAAEEEVQQNIME